MEPETAQIEPPDSQQELMDSPIDQRLNHKDTPSSRKGYRRLINFISWIARLGVGGLFVFSGFVKAIDPWGTIYKFEEYLSAMGMHFLPTVLITCVFALCAFEFCVGIFLLFGCYRKSSPILALAMICVMLPLTLWVAMSDPVADCGCFGDAWIISNWATFWKNVAITAAILWLLKFNRQIPTIISPAFQWMSILASILFIIAIGLYGYWRQPLIDFRPYPVGSSLVDLNAGEGMDWEQEPAYVFIYQKDGQKKEFSIDDELPDEDEGWEFVERKEIATNSHSGNNSQQYPKTFRIWNKEGDHDVTSEVMNSNGKTLLMLIPELKRMSPASTWKINSLYDWSKSHGINMIAVVAGSTDDIAIFEDLSMPQYEIFTGDDTSIKEVARGNPAIVYVENNVIKWKSRLDAIDVDDFMKGNVSADPMNFAFDNHRTLMNCVWLYVACMAVLVAMSMMPRLRNIYNAVQFKRHSDKIENQIEDK